MTSKRMQMKLFVALAALAAAACNVDESGKIKCADDSSCPSDYPVCGSGVCIAGTSTTQNAVAVIGVAGKQSTDPVRGTVTVQVAARASTGVASVALTSGTQSFSGTASTTPGVFNVPVDTTKLADGTVTLTATVTAGNGTTITAQSTLVVDNTAPTFPQATVTPATAQDGMMVKLDVQVSESLGALAGPVTTSTGGSAGQMAEIAPATPAAGATPEVRHLGYLVTSTNPVGTYTVTLTATDRAGNVSAPLAKTFDVVLPPTVASFSASPSVISSGDMSTLTATFANGIATVDNGIGAVTTGQGTSTGTLTNSMTFKVTVTNAAGVSVTAEARVTVAAPPAITSFTAPAAATSVTLTSGGNVILTPVFTNGTAQISNSADSTVVTATSGTGFDTGPLSSSRTYALTVSNAAGLSVTRTVLVTVVPAPICTSLIPSPSTITAGTSTLLTPTFANGTGSIDQGVGAVSSGTAVTSGTLNPTLTGGTATVTFTLTVTNAAGTACTAPAANVTVVAAPTITAFTITSSAGSTTPLTTITAGTGVVAKVTFSTGSPTGGLAILTNDGSATNNVILTSGVATASLTPAVGTGAATVVNFTATVTNSAGTQSTKTVTVTVVPAPAIGTNLTASSATNTALCTAAQNCVVATGTTDVTLSASFSNGTASVRASNGASATMTSGSPLALSAFSPPITSVASPLTFALTVTNASGATASSQVVTVSISQLSSTSATTPQRSGHTATLLPNGKVLLAGGTLGGLATRTSVIFDPTAVSPTFTTIGDDAAANSANLTCKRTGHAAVLLPNGKVLVAGGCNDTAANSISSDIFDPTAGTYTAGPTLLDPSSQVTPLGRKQFTLVVATSATNQTLVVMAAGRQIGGPGPSVNDTFTTSGTFAATWDMSGAAFTSLTIGTGTIRARAMHTSTVLSNGKILLAGGESESGATQTVLNTSDVLDPFAGTIASGGNMTAARELHAAVKLSSGSVIVFGGSGDQSSLTQSGLNSVDFFDATSGQFDSTAASTRGGFAIGRFNLTGTLLISGEILLAGGQATTAGLRSTAVEVYNPNLVAGAVTGGVEPNIPQLKSARSQHSASALVDGTVAIVGGTSGSASAEIYDPNP